MDNREFSVSGMDGAGYDCRFQTLILGIAPRHSDTADVTFLVNGKPAVVALPLKAFAELRRRTGRALTDADVILIAASFLRKLLETEGLREDRMLAPPEDDVIADAANIHSVL